MAGMALRSGQVVGSHLLPPQAQPAFEEGIKLLFRRWTALTLAVENQWGGVNSADKANYLVEDTIEWFRLNKGDSAARQRMHALLSDPRAALAAASAAWCGKTWHRRR